ncbi:MAG: glycosyltransferase family 4 protein [Armatimonadetes bacterium]|nr:glycosyltransferase family 4 protein [Armatimonadota bacterium]
MSSPKIVYIARMRMPTERAHGVQVMKTCEALVEAGADVTLCHSTRRQTPEMRGVDPFEYYGIQHRFRLKRVPHVDVASLQGLLPWIILGRLYLAANLLFGLTTLLWLLRERADLYMTRHWATAWFLVQAGRPTVFEVHQTDTEHVSGRVAKLVARMSKNPNLRRLVTISEGLRDELVVLGANPEKIVVLPDAVDLRGYASRLTKTDARSRAGLPDGRPLAVYTGQLLAHKGVDVLAQSAAYLDGVRVVFVGGSPEDRRRIEAIAAGAGDVQVVEHVPPGQVPAYQMAADVLVLPQTGLESQSPLKLYEYMAAGRPIVASDLAPLREVLSAENALLVTPGDPQALAEGIRRLVDDEELAERLSSAAYAQVQRSTWRDRAESILACAGLS